ncbi:MAG TPA: DOMON-like domain-containing protein [Steroidobacteraceae bacterium]|jgi:hypothetical protein|nr:DOMON-like domain-containing protein [Steroidobacteraceae bacterium]
MESARVAQRALLLPHPDASGDAVWNVAVDLQLAAPATLVCHYTMSGDMARVRVPVGGAGHRTDGLWKHTCCEAFVAAPGVPGYHEFNFSPALDWAAYRFDDYRTGMTAATLTQAPGLQVRRTAGQLELTATVHLAGVASLRSAGTLQLALAAVIEEQSGRLAYWALRHGPGNPDFHHPDNFALELHAA